MGICSSSSPYDKYITQVSLDYDPNYVLNLVIRDLGTDSLENIQEDLLHMNHRLIYSKINEIMDVLRYYIKNKDIMTLRQTDYFLFTFHGLPILKITNMNSFLYKPKGEQYKFSAFICKLHDIPISSIC